MRYEFEVGDYVKLIANKTISSKPIGYIGKVLRTKMFSGFGVCCALDSDDMSWSQFSDLAPATKAEYEAYHKSKFPEYIECTQTKEPYFIKGNIYKVTYVSALNSVRVTSNIKCSDYDAGDELWVTCQDKDGTYYKASTKEAYEAQNKPKPKFKVGDWVTDDDARNVYKIGRIYNDKYYPSSSSWYTTQNGKLANTSLSFCWDLRLATEAEVKQHLLAEASRRGFKVGVDYTLNGNRNTAKTNPELYVNSISRFNLHCGYGCGLIYNDSTGEWATILPTEKELYGYKVNKTKGSSLINIGCKAISEGEIQGFLNVCEKFSITGVYSEYVKGQSIGLDAIKEALK